MATVFLSKRRNRKTQRLQTQGTHTCIHTHTCTETNKQIKNIQKWPLDRKDKKYKESIRLKAQAESYGFDATVGVSHQAPKLKVISPKYS